jgi:hypothetical protein
MLRFAADDVKLMTVPQLEISRYLGGIMITKVRNGMSSTAAVVEVQAIAMAELPLRI